MCGLSDRNIFMKWRIMCSLEMLLEAKLRFIIMSLSRKRLHAGIKKNTSWHLNLNQWDSWNSEKILSFDYKNKSVSINGEDYTSIPYWPKEDIKEKRRENRQKCNAICHQWWSQQSSFTLLYIYIGMIIAEVPGVVFELNLFIHFFIHF